MTLLIKTQNFTCSPLNKVDTLIKSPIKKKFLFKLSHKSNLVSTISTWTESHSKTYQKLHKKIKDLELSNMWTTVNTLKTWSISVLMRKPKLIIQLSTCAKTIKKAILNQPQPDNNGKASSTNSILLSWPLVTRTTTTTSPAQVLRTPKVHLLFKWMSRRHSLTQEDHFQLLLVSNSLSVLRLETGRTSVSLNGTKKWLSLNSKVILLQLLLKQSKVIEEVSTKSL